MLKSVRKRAAALWVVGFALVLQLVAAILFAAPASAAVWNCNYGYNSTGAYAYCASGDTTYFEAHVLCQNKFTYDSRVVNGPRQRVGGQKPSVITGCAWYEHYYGQPWASSA